MTAIRATGARGVLFALALALGCEIPSLADGPYTQCESDEEVNPDEWCAQRGSDGCFFLKRETLEPAFCADTCTPASPSCRDPYYPGVRAACLAVAKLEDGAASSGELGVCMLVPEDDACPEELRQEAVVLASGEAREICWFDR